jgi:hypothetical protein
MDLKQNYFSPIQIAIVITLETDNFDKDILPYRDVNFDSSNYPKDHFLYSLVNAKV